MRIFSYSSILSLSVLYSSSTKRERVITYQDKVGWGNHIYLFVKFKFFSRLMEEQLKHKYILKDTYFIHALNIGSVPQIV